MSKMPLTAMRLRLTRLNRELREDPGTVVHVTHRGKHSLVVMSAELYETIAETLDVMSDPEAADALLASRADIEAGRVRTLDQVARRLRPRKAGQEKRRRPAADQPTEEIGR